jgi:two-component system, sensor histidine kinase and response regulator
MFSISIPYRDWIYSCTTVLLLSLASFQVSAQDVSHYISKLDESSTAEQFDQIFGAMVKDFKSGKPISFQDEEVMRIVTIARSKPYAEAILPGVYGWAATLFGDGRVDQALLFFMESAELYGKQNKKHAQALASFEIALIHHKAENYEEAETFYLQTLALGGDSLSHRMKINCYNGFALIERNKENFSKATMEFRKAYRIAEMHRDTVWMGILAGNIGSIHMKTTNYDSSLYYYSRNLKFIKNTLEFENEIETYAHIGKIYWSKSDYKRAKLYLDSATQIIENRKIRFNDFFNPMDYINETYALIYASLGDHKKAFDYYTRFHEIAQQKQLKLNGRSLKQLQSTYTFERKQHEVELLTKINEANVLVIQQQRYIAIAFGIIIVLMTIWAVNAYNTGLQRKKLNSKLSESNAELERLNRVKDRLFSVLSHDLRSPIATLKSMVIFLADGKVKHDDVRALYSGLRQQLEVSDNILESLLQWAKAELSQTKVEMQRLVMANLVNNVALQLKTVLDEKGILLQNDLNFDLIALGDKIQLEIILRNLMANAVKFTPKGGVIRIAGKVNADSLEIYVEDNGLGMHEEEVKNLFEPGKHFSKVGTNKEMGNGLGLIITKEMISKNGGNIWVNSRKHEGTIFTFTLPLAS